ALTDDELYPSELADPRRKRKRALIAVFTIILVGGAVVGLAGRAVWTHVKEVEEHLAAQALKDYTDGRFAIAAEEFEKLLTENPQSPKKSDYEFLLALSLSRDRAYNAGEQVVSARDEFGRFLADHRGDSHLKDDARKEDVRQTLVVLALTMTDQAEKDLDTELLH